jgi:protein-tyrosine kinase
MTPVAESTMAAVIPQVVNIPVTPVTLVETQPLRYLQTSVRDGGPEVEDEDRQKLTMQMRSVKRSLLNRLKARRAAGFAPIVVVTSALPGDGKSFVSFHLARTLCTERDLSVTLIDADVVRHRTSDFFSGAEGGGLSHCLVHDTSLAQVARRSDINGLQVVPAGTPDPAAEELLASSQWDRLANEMKEAGGSSLFLIDTAPVLATTESQYLAQSADLVIFVVRSDVTPAQAVAEAMSRLEDHSRVAFVFNGHVSPGMDYYYGYNYQAPANAKSST